MNTQSTQRFGCYIGNIDRSVPLEMLRQLFSQCGTILDCSLNGRDEDPYRYGFIDFATEEDRQRAMRFNGFPLNDRKLKVGISKGNVNKPESAPGNRRLNNNNNNNNIPNFNNNNSNNNNTDIAGNSFIPGASSGLGSLLPGGIPSGLSPAQIAQLMQMLQSAQGQPGAPAVGPQGTGTTPQPPFMMPPATPSPMPGNIPPPMGYPGMNNSMHGMNPAMHPMGGPWGPGMVGGGFPPNHPMGHMPPPHRMPFPRGPANPPPSEEVLKMREKQRAEFYDVVRKDAEKYEKKMAEKASKEKKGDAGAITSDDDSSDDEGEQPRKVRRAETIDEK